MEDRQTIVDDTKTIYNEYLKFGHIDLDFQREHAWMSTNDKSWIFALAGISGKKSCDRYFRLIDVESSLKVALSTNNVKDIEYFNSLVKEGYKYLFLDGGNRGRNLIKVFEHNMELSSSILERIEKSELILDIYFGWARKEIFDDIRDTNLVRRWNRNNHLNANDTQIKKTMRQYVDKHSDFLISLLPPCCKQANSKLFGLMSELCFSYFNPLKSYTKNDLLKFIQTDDKLVIKKTNAFYERLKIWMESMGKIQSLTEKKYEKLQKDINTKWFMSSLFRCCEYKTQSLPVDFLNTVLTLSPDERRKVSVGNTTESKEFIYLRYRKNYLMK
jgi:hypothetical protein